MAKFTLDSKLGDVLKNAKARDVYESIFPGTVKNPQTRMAFGMTINALAAYVPDTMTPEKLAELEKALAAIE